MKKYIFILLLLAFTSCEKNEITYPSSGNVDRFYPTTLRKLSRAELDSLKVKFNNKLLGTMYQAKLDSFGLLGHYGLRPRGKSNISDTAQAITLAKTALLCLSEFSNIVDTSTIYVEETRHFKSGPITDWRFYFRNQYYQGLEVWNTHIHAIVADDFIFLDGHHYRNIFIPKHKIISKERAKMNLVGTEIYFYCWDLDTAIITDSSINIEMIEQCIYPIVKSNSIELHVAWKVPISGYSKFPFWYYFIDVVTGETLGVMQLFIC